MVSVLHLQLGPKIELQAQELTLSDILDFAGMSVMSLSFNMVIYPGGTVAPL
jgi:hypothetical protein